MSGSQACTPVPYGRMTSLKTGAIADTTAWSSVVNGLMFLGLAVLAVAADLWLGWVDRHPPKAGTFGYRHWEAAQRYTRLATGFSALPVSAV